MFEGELGIRRSRDFRPCGEAGFRESTLGPGWAELGETGQGSGLPFTKMAGAVTPEGAEQLVAVVTEGECCMLMRLARSWAVEGSARGDMLLPPAVVQACGGHRLPDQDFQRSEPASKSIFARKS